MKLSLNWLESYFITKPNWNLVWDKLTMAGIEVEGIEPVAPVFSGIVVAKVISCEKHPEADKLSKCMVDTGTGELLQIICGAPNVKAGIKIPCAKVGAVLPDGLEIAERKMRGLTSFGMLCSGNEIACPDGIDGLLILPDSAEVGVSIRDYLDLDDQIVEFKITPNRSDCLSVKGLLREIAVLTGCEIKPFQVENLKPLDNDQIKITMSSPLNCPNYMALAIKDVNNNVILPENILKRIQRSGLRSISPIVDITNYVMLELGQPLHAFDSSKVGDQLHIRMAANNESLKLLDGKVATLKDNTLLICDANDAPVAIAGVMGGFDSGVKADTTSIILESAYFTPETISGRAKQYGVNSDSAYRYERGVDPKLQEIAQAYAANLILKYCGGKIGQQIKVTNQLAKPPSINVNYNQLNQLIGTQIPEPEINKILIGLGFEIEVNSSSVFVTPPSYRFDIAIKEDIVEEVARIYGYDNIPPIMPITAYTIMAPNKTMSTSNRLKDQLVTLGYNEIVSYAFIEDKYEEILGTSDTDVVKLLNPIAGLSIMRTSLIADLIKALINNLNRGHKNIKLFELARVFHGEDANSQPLKLSGLVHGNYYVPGWGNTNKTADFFDVKHDIGILLSNLPDISYKALKDNSVFHAGRAALIYSADIEVGVMGQLHPKLGQDLGLNELPYLFELDFTSLIAKIGVVSVHELSKFQKVVRDLAFVLPELTPVGEIVKVIKQAKIQYLVDITVFDIYHGSNLENGYKSVAINFVFQGQKNLADDEVNSNMTKIIELVTTEFSATLRQ